MFTLLELVIIVLSLITLYYTVFWLLAFIDYSPARPGEVKKQPRVSVIVPAFNEESSLEKTARSVLALDYPKGLLELIIVDDGSRDRTLAVAEKIRKSALKEGRRVIVLSQENQGKWKAMNSGISASFGEFVACLDADSTVKPDALVKMLPYFAGEDIAVVLPMLHVDSPGNLLQKVQWHEYVINMFYRKVAGFLNCIHVAPGPFSLYRKSILLRIGGFREGHKTEDLEICLRLQSLGYRILQITEAEVYTETPSKLREFYRQRLRWNLGSTLNIIDYKGMLFNTKYGDFGVFQLPIIFLATFFAAIILLVTFFLSVVKPFYEKFTYLRLVDFDIMTMVRNFHFSFSVLDIDYFSVFVGLCFSAISVSVLVMAHRSIKRKVTAHGLPATAVFLFLYYLLLGYVRLVVIKELLLKKKNRW
ncbi:glycosyltransferase family 2 protein [Candidatus Woesearchaeota archaeon]|nr:glycosyltransferase family 2 protein [Candidatus Woesearchaeota archaeon]